MSSLPLAALGGRGGFAPDPRFCDAAPKGQEDQPGDPLAEAYARGHADALASCRAAMEAEWAEREAARGRIELSLGRLDEDCMAALQDSLRTAVLALCECSVLPLALDEAGLAARIEAALAMLVRAQDERVVLLHPADLDLLSGRLPDGVEFREDPTIERGGLRIETADGGIEDGPSQWRRILAEALGEC